MKPEEYNEDDVEQGEVFEQRFEETEYGKKGVMRR